MTSVWPPSKAEPADAATIASLFALSWISPFSKLQFGHIEPAALIASMAPRIAQLIGKQNTLFIVIRNPYTHDVAAVAQWSLPTDDDELIAAEETKEEQDERQAFEDEAYMNNLPKNSNRDLIMKFTIGLRELRQKVLRGRRHYLLENLATHPDYRGMGLASRLVEYIFSYADAESALVYLDTASDNPARRLYERLGFKEEGRHTVENVRGLVTQTDYEEYGNLVEHIHVAFLRYPEGTMGVAGE
jgi:ribosomal protein S18 acetylase RimI-like enzyme